MSQIVPRMPEAGSQELPAQPLSWGNAQSGAGSRMPDGSDKSDARRERYPGSHRLHPVTVPVGRKPTHTMDAEAQLNHSSVLK